MKFDIGLFWKSFEKIQESLKSDKSDWCFKLYLCTFVTVDRWIVLKMRDIPDKTIEIIKTHIFVRQLFFLETYRLWNNVENGGRTG